MARIEFHIMILSRLSLAILISPLVITACAQPAATRQVDVDSEPARNGIPHEPFPATVATTAAATHEPSPGLPTSAASLTREPYLISTENNAWEQANSGVDSTSEPESPAEEAVETGSSPIPGGSATQIPAWEGPGIVYFRYSAEDLQDLGEIIISNLDGSRKSVTQTVPEYVEPQFSDYSPETGRIVYAREDSLWVIHEGIEHRNILPSTGDLIQSPVISSDGTKIAYSLLSIINDGTDLSVQLWVINTDGSENKLLFDNIGQYITDPQPSFGLRPVAWSLDNRKIYLITTTFTEAFPVGMYVADLESGTIRAALAPQVTFWDVPFSPDRTRIAYRPIEWIFVQNSAPEIQPPFTLQVADLTTGATRILLNSNEDQYFNPIWSDDGDQIAYTIRQSEMGPDVGLFTFDLTAGTSKMIVAGSENSSLTPWIWLSEDRLVYSEGALSSGNSWNPFTTLYTVNIDGSDKREIDSGWLFNVLGAVDG